MKIYHENTIMKRICVVGIIINNVPTIRSNAITFTSNNLSSILDVIYK